jgi:Na+:H+ antiporter, NhaA family
LSANNTGSTSDIELRDPPGAWGPLRRLAQLAGRPVERFLHVEAASGILLMLASAVALFWANSPWSDHYFSLWHTPLAVRVGSLTFERPLEWVVNDGLMAIFFFVVGMEIRREIHGGELSSLQRAALPMAAALGGMLAPAALYLLIAGAPETHHGWGVPMATDIAFAVGILTLLGKRVPPALRVLLLALAVIDDLGAIVVIALFYSAGVHGAGVLVALFGLAAIVLLQRIGVRTKLIYVAPAVVAWAGTYAAGVHPTIAGVLIGLLTPVRAWLGPDGFRAVVDQGLRELPAADVTSEVLGSTLARVDVARREARSPAESLIERLHPWVAFAIMPVFALANAGVRVSADSSLLLASPALWGTAVGLVVGKPVGILLSCGLALSLRIGVLPRGLGAKHLVLLGLVAGVGFTMALFIAQLAFTEERTLAAAKLGVLGASGCAAAVAWLFGRLSLEARLSSDCAQTEQEAESSTVR